MAFTTKRLPGSDAIIEQDTSVSAKAYREEVVIRAPAGGSGTPVSGTVTANQGTAGATAWPIQAGGYTTVIQVTPNLNVASAYVSGDLVGQKNTLANAVRTSGGTGVLGKVTVIDLNKQSLALDLIFFNTDPTNTTFTDSGAFDIHDTDILTILGIVSITAADYAAFVDNSCASKGNIGIPFKVTSGTSIYMAVVTRGSPTYANGDLVINVGIYQD